MRLKAALVLVKALLFRMLKPLLLKLLVWHAMVVRDGVDFESLDGEPARLFFLIAAS